VTLVDGTTYQIVSRAVDNAGNTEVVMSTRTVFYDTTVPEAGIISPLNDVDGGYYSEANLLSSITGTAEDKERARAA